MHALPHGSTIRVSPCSLRSLLGRCEIITESQCKFEAGLWHDDKQLCSQVPCLDGTCDTYSGATVEGKNKPEQNQIETPDQWWRFITPIFMHSGGIHFVVRYTHPGMLTPLAC